MFVGGIASFSVGAEPRVGSDPVRVECSLQLWVRVVESCLRRLQCGSSGVRVSLPREPRCVNRRAVRGFRVGVRILFCVSHQIPSILPSLAEGPTPNQCDSLTARSLG